MKNTDIYISAFAFYSIADWSFCSRYAVKLSPNDFKENDIVFLNLDMLDEFLRIMNKIPPAAKFILITHNSDTHFNDKHFASLNGMANKVYAVHNTCKNKDVVTLPLGFQDIPTFTISIIKDTPRTNAPRDFLLYLNFDIQTNIRERLSCFNTFVQADWAVKFRRIQHKEYYHHLMRSKYVLCPEGCGIDCNRVYECIYFGAIPILRTNSMNEFYKKLPVITVENWSDITEDLLVINYQQHYDNLQKWLSENRDWLNPAFWINK